MRCRGALCVCAYLRVEVVRANLARLLLVQREVGSKAQAQRAARAHGAIRHHQAQHLRPRALQQPHL